MSKRSRFLVVGSIAGAVVLAVAVTVGVVALVNRDAPPDGTTSPTAAPSASSPTSSPPATSGGRSDDAEAHGWVQEPVTTDPGEYAEAALRAISTFDTTLSTREEYLAYLETWMTPQVGNTTTGEINPDATENNKRILDREILPTEEMWAGLAEARGFGAPEYDAIEQLSSGVINIYSVEVDTVYTPREEGNFDSGPWAESRNILIQLMCNEWAVPSPEKGQQLGDCKVVRWVDSTD